jgi:hypothetical protein
MRPAPAAAAEGSGAARERPPRERVERPGSDDAATEQLRLRALREFREADTDGDGFLSPDEARRFPFVTKEFGRVDTDGDGRISSQEFMRLRRMQSEKKPLQ